MSDKACPVCGSKKIEKTISKELLQEDLGAEILIDKITYKCLDCESEGDFFHENDAVIEKALDTVQKQFVASLLDEFSNQHIRFAAIERALGLPQRTLTKWKNGMSTPTAAGIALLKIIKLFPWIIDVAENNYNYEYAQKLFLNMAFHTMVDKIPFVETGSVTLKFPKKENAR
jgi:DNA-binding transcriptional regulator YiaG